MNVTERALRAFGQRRVTLYILRRNDVLAQLQTLSNVSASAIRHENTLGRNEFGKTSAGTKRGRSRESSPPSGVLWKVEEREPGGSRAPDPQRSLFDHYRWRFEHEVGANLYYGGMLCEMAERDYDSAVGRVVDVESTAELEHRIVNAYPGMHPLRVAIIEGLDDEWLVVRLRQQGGVDGMTGLDARWADDLEAAGFEIDPLLSDEFRAGSLSMAQDLLRAELACGPRRASDLIAMAKERGLSPKTMQRARAALGVQSGQRGRAWFWAMPGATAPGDGQVVNGGQVTLPSVAA